MDPITARTVRYIKLGPGGAWVQHCLANGEIEFGYAGEPFDHAAAGDWDGVVAHYVRQGKILAKARDAMREIQDFVTLGPDCLWITFADHHLWWAFAEPGVIVDPSPQPGHGVCRRRALGGWRKTDIAGGSLRIDGLTSKLTQVAAYRQTICSVKASDYLLRRINTVPEPVLIDARSARATLVRTASAMIADLHWSDFEVLVDLIFARGGWQRTSRLGEMMADIDLLIEQPTLSEVASVQVKSRATQAVLDAHMAHFAASGLPRTFFVCHSPDGALATGGARGVHLWTGEPLAEMAIKSGLFDWLMERVG